MTKEQQLKAKLSYLLELYSDVIDRAHKSADIFIANEQDEYHVLTKNSYLAGYYEESIKNILSEIEKNIK